jgi:FkbM family methyltransferase
MAGPEASRRGSEGLLRRAAQGAYTVTRDAVWKLPITRWPAAAHAAVRVGFWARRLLRLAPPGEALGLVHGHQMLFGPGSECYLDMTRGRWEPGVTRLLETVVQPGMTVVDAGAHIGYFSLLAARRVGPGGRVYAFEPAPENFELLARNIALNAYRNVVPVRKAVSDHEGVETFFLHPDSVAHSLLAETFGRPHAAIQVETTTLDHFFATQGWPPIHLVKLDIEGGEPEALDGMAKLLARNRGLQLILEFIPYILRRARRDPRAFLTTLRDLGFRIHLITDDHKLRAFDERLCDNLELHAELWCEREEQLIETDRRYPLP